MGKKKPTAQAMVSPWEQFASRHVGQPFLAAPVLYALTVPIIDAVQAEVPEFFAADQEVFERDLARTASFGFFQGRALGFARSEEGSPTSLRERHARSSLAINDLLKEEFRRSGVTEPQIHQYFQSGSERRDVIDARKDAFVGWLITNRAFQTEVATLRGSWENLVRELGRFPVFPRWPLHDLGLDREVPEDFRCDLLVFYSRWGLNQMLTWEWPVPMEPDLVGGMVEHTNLLAETGVSFFVPWYLLRGEKLNLQEVARRQTTVDAPAHLREWMEKKGPKPDTLGDLRYERLAWLYRYLGLALWRRYPQACHGRARKLDYALSQVLDRDEESVRKARLELQRALPES